MNYQKLKWFSIPFVIILTLIITGFMYLNSLRAVANQEAIQKCEQIEECIKHEINKCIIDRDEYEKGDQYTRNLLDEEDPSIRYMCQLLGVKIGGG
ncbi:MAG: hypothetical protein F6K36_25615 [Symploca sp. SIO3C6]|uniref:Uncharacterized protein n=1 Tax=Symploca sp. SIO1C4 TaxID=2607765 RepID=A0A6B3ND14_9CYAN|nr:hypothetical protein [Symploca sp. SIO3C6]NER28502.1 hypothetical protein [Symploca sp. SIO1C4]